MGSYRFKETLRVGVTPTRQRSVQVFRQQKEAGDDVHGISVGKTLYHFKQGSAAEFVRGILPAEVQWLAKNGRSDVADTLSLDPAAGGGGERFDWCFGEQKDGYPRNLAALLRMFDGRDRPPPKMAKAYAEASEAIRARAGKLKRAAATLRRQRCYRIDDGDEVDIDRMLSGQPDVWRSRTRGKKRPTVTIAIQLVQSAMCDSASFARIAACTAAAVGVIEAAGVAVRILGVWSGHGMGSYKPHETHPTLGNSDAEAWIHSFPIKEAGETFNPHRMLSQSQSGVLRSLMFGYVCLCVSPVPSLGHVWTPCKGHPVRKLLGVDHWIGKAPRDGVGEQVEMMEAILQETIPQLTL